MVTGVGFRIITSGDPCSAAPTMTSVGTPAVQTVGNCLGQNLTIRITVSLSGTLTGTGCKIQRRTHFGTSSTPSYGSWTDLATTGSSITHDYNAGILTTDSGAGTPGSGATYYYNAQYQIIGTDGSTVCDGPDSSSQWSGTVYQCFD